jgi:hypothetical protein
MKALLLVLPLLFFGCFEPHTKYKIKVSGEPNNWVYTNSYITKENCITFKGFRKTMPSILTERTFCGSYQIIKLEGNSKDKK